MLLKLLHLLVPEVKAVAAEASSGWRWTGRQLWFRLWTALPSMYFLLQLVGSLAYCCPTSSLLCFCHHFKTGVNLWIWLATQW